MATLTLQDSSPEFSPFMMGYGEQDFGDEYEVPDALRHEIGEAAEHAYIRLAGNSFPAEQFHLARLCYDLSDSMRADLVASGHNARVETHTDVEGLANQNYVVVETPERREVIADPTWQLHVPTNRRGSQLPRVLVGTRDQAIQIARSHGVPEDRLKLWEVESLKMSPEAQAQADRDAEVAAEEAEEQGRWDKFMSGTNR